MHRIYYFSGTGNTRAIAKKTAALLGNDIELISIADLQRGSSVDLSGLDSVEISIVDDPTIAAVHGEFLDDPTATDAITFPYGEVLVSCDTAAAYAAAHGLPREEELFRYMVHGLTHLHGYLDYEPADRDALFAVQEPLVKHYFPVK